MITSSVLDRPSKSQAARAARKTNRLQGIAAAKAANRAQNVKDKEAADLRRRAEAVPGTDRAPALARAFRAVRAAKAVA